MMKTTTTTTIIDCNEDHTKNQFDKYILKKKHKYWKIGKNEHKTSFEQFNKWWFSYAKHQTFFHHKLTPKITYHV
jgi:hypothetical protein